MDTLSMRRAELARRLRATREQLFGDDSGALADALGLPPRTWANYEAGVAMPAEVLLLFLERTGVNPGWLLHGRGSMRPQRWAASRN